MRRLIRSTALLGLGSAATVVAAILRAKVLAHFLGPQGTGLMAQLSSLTAVLVPLATLGMGNGITAMVAAARAKGDLFLAQRIRATSIHLSWLVGLSLAAAAALASPWLASALYRDRGLTWVILVGAATVPLSAIASLRISILQGYEAVKSMAALNTIMAVVGVSAIVPLAWLFGLRGAVAQLIIVAIAYVWVSGRLVKRSAGEAGHAAASTRAGSIATHGVRAEGEAGPAGEAAAATAAASAGAATAGGIAVPAQIDGPHTRGGAVSHAGGRTWPRIDRALLRPLFRYGFAALLVGLSSTLTLLILRSVLVSKLGLGPNGIYQVCVGISGLCMPLILNSITAIVWPQIAAQRSSEETAVTMREALRLAMLLMTAATGAMLAGAPVWVPIFYSGKFLPALDLLPIQFIGDYFRTIAWMCGIWLVPKNRLRPWVLFDVVYGITILVVFLLLVDRVGVRSMVIAYVAAHVTHAVLHYLLARGKLDFHLGPDNRRLLLASFALLLGLAAFTPRNATGVALGVLALGVWAVLVVKPEEWRTVWTTAQRAIRPLV